MRIESALYSSREGINAHGGAISVVGDNIANSNTTGYKVQRSEFSDLVADNGNSPSTIPNSGNGVQLDRVRVNFEQGLVEDTGRSLDAAVSGNGFFVVGDPESPVFTRDGVFELGEDGSLQTRGGFQVLGTPAGAAEGTLAPLNINGVNLQGEATTEIQITGNIDSASQLVEQLPDGDVEQALVNGTASFTSPIEVFDSLGQRHNVQLAYFKTDVNQWTVRAYAAGEDVGGEEGVLSQLGEVVLNFDNTGQIPEADKANALLNINANWANGAAAGAFTVDLGQFTQFANQSQLQGVTSNGQSAGSVTDYFFSDEGQFMAQLDNGEQVEVGTLLLASFGSRDGLERAGESIFRSTERAGEITFNRPGEGSAGGLEGNSLERSTVDISKEFVDLVLLQRGYQANSRILNTTSDILQETIGLLR